MKDAAWRETYGGLVPDEVLAGLDARRPAAVQRWEQRLLDGAYLWLALDGDDVVGVASGPRHDDDDVDVLLELQMLYLLDRVKGTGLAQVLLTTTLGDVDAYLWVARGQRTGDRLLPQAGVRARRCHEVGGRHAGRGP